MATFRSVLFVLALIASCKYHLVDGKAISANDGKYYKLGEGDCDDDSECELGLVCDDDWNPFSTDYCIKGSI